jgi:flavin reductase (DIM6/NTAB) family NADH-FMN oxidoreductase RutF
MEINPDGLPVRDRYKLMIGCILPRPIAFVSTVSTEGKLNLAPFSFFSGVGANPMTVLFCPANNPDGSEKDTLRNAKPIVEGGLGQFVVNVAPYRIIKQVAAAAEPLPFGESEFDLSGLTPAPSRVVKPPRVTESPVSFECETQLVHRTNFGQPSGGNIVIGRVVHIHIDADAIDDRFHIDPDVLDNVGRMGGLAYCRTRDRFELPMTREALDVPLE